MDKKIVLFTTIGKLSDEAKIHVNDSFTSWKEFGFDVVVFGEDFPCIGSQPSPRTNKSPINNDCIC